MGHRPQPGEPLKKLYRLRWLWLTLWLIGMLFPLGAMRQVSYQWQAVIDSSFSGEWRHITMHILLFAGLVLLLFAMFHLPWSRRGWLEAAVAVLIVGAVQEIIQAITGASAATWSGAIFDLVIDLIGGALGVGVWGVGLLIRKK